MSVTPRDTERLLAFIEVLNLDLSEQLAAEFGYDHPVLVCLDAVLSIRRPYQTFVVPRINAFRERYGDVDTLPNLRKLIEQHSEDGFVDVWNYRHPERVRMLDALAVFFLAHGEKHCFTDDLAAMRHWAEHFNVAHKQSLDVAGIGPATTQYLRMLLGVSTVKPDRHIHRTVQQALGRRVTNGEAISLVEAVAKRLGVGALVLDHAIWRWSSGGAEHQ